MMQRRKHMMSREKFISVLFRQQQSGLSIADFCENEGYSRSRFYLWKQKYGITEYFLCPGYTDMRKGMFTLCGLVHERMGGDIRSGDVFIFYNRFRTKIKLLHAEPGGLVLYEKLLEEGTFKIPAYDPATRSYPMTWSDLVVMVEGINEDVSKGRQRRLSNLKKHW